MWKVMEEFHLKNPYIIKQRSSKDIELMKKMFAQDQTTIICRHISKILMNDQPKTKTALLFVLINQLELWLQADVRKFYQNQCH